MPRNEVLALVETLLNDGITVEDRTAVWAQSSARLTPDQARQVFGHMLSDHARRGAGLRESQEHLQKVREVNDKLSAPPWHPSIFIRAVSTPQGLRAIVAQGATRRVVGFAEGVDATALTAGDEVFLSEHLNVIMGRAPYGLPCCGEMACFERYASDGRLIVRGHGEEEMVIEAAGPLRSQTLRSGDLVRLDRAVQMAFEKMERSQGAQFFLEDTPMETFDHVGGLDAMITQLKLCIELHLRHPDVVRRYHLRRRGSVMLFGPPGTGKTLLARALANWLATLSKSGRSRFMNIKPGALHSMWYSQSEANYREVFRIARQAGEQEPDVPIVMFFDEVDAMGMHRGDSVMRVDDRVMAAFIAELQGLESRGNILVVSASNRRDAIDPALLRPGRLGDLILEVRRPNMKAAADILGKHLHPDIPYAGNGNGHEAAALRQEAIQSAVARIYSANGESDLATLVFRDGARRVVKAHDLISGAVIANIARAATEQACVRETKTGAAGVRAEDLLSAVADEFECAAGALTPANCRKYLSDLPHDKDVVSVEPVVRKVKRPHQYVTRNVA